MTIGKRLHQARARNPFLSPVGQLGLAQVDFTVQVPSFTVFYSDFVGCTGFTQFYSVLPSFPEFYGVLPGFT